MQLHHARIRYNDIEQIFPAGKMTFFDECYLDFKVEDSSAQKRYQITLHPKQDIHLQALELVFDFPVEAHQRIFCNGYQSWSESREFSPTESIERLRPFAKKWLQYAGDQQFNTTTKGKGYLHSWTYTYRRIGTRLDFFGSLREDTAFTIFQFDLARRQLIVRKDIDKLALSHSFPVLDVLYTSGSMSEVFDRWTKATGKTRTPAPPLTGWTSWYQHYTNISEAIIQDNLAAFDQLQLPIDIIQIDDGFQTAVGDWLSIKPDFPKGMSAVAAAIHQKGFKAGLWLAPFVCDTRSKIFKQHPDWLLKDQQGQLVKAGYNLLWGGWFYTLNFYHKEVQDYLTGVFFTVLNKWNYDLLKLDFLYAVCLAPPPDKTRGQVMHEAMQFLRHNLGDKLLLACGVPLAAAFYTADYCRIGADIHLQWEHGLLAFLRHRERVSTKIALRSTIARWPLNGRFFHNDPDVCILREAKNKLTPNQQYSILLINRLLGNLLFTSDNPVEYSPEVLSEFQLLFTLQEVNIQGVEDFGRDRYRIDYDQSRQNYAAYCNLSPQKWLIDGFELEAYESMIRTGVST